MVLSEKTESSSSSSSESDNEGQNTKRDDKVQEKPLINEEQEDQEDVE
jgi:hypothetical protein